MTIALLSSLPLSLTANTREKAFRGDNGPHISNEFRLSFPPLENKARPRFSNNFARYNLAGMRAVGMGVNFTPGPTNIHGTAVFDKSGNHISSPDTLGWRREGQREGRAGPL